MDYQYILILIRILGIIVSFLGILLIGFIIYYLSLRVKNERENLFSKLPIKFQQQLEELISQEMKKTTLEASQKIKKATDEIIESYKKQMVDVPQEVEKEFSQIRKVNVEAQEKLLKRSENKMADLEQNIKSEISKFSGIWIQAQDTLLQETKNKAEEIGKGLADEINLIYQSADKTIKQKIAQTEKDINDYKKEKIKEIDQKIYQMIGEVAKKTLGEIIDLSTHEKLVIEALEKAKKEKIL